MMAFFVLQSKDCWQDARSHGYAPHGYVRNCLYFLGSEVEKPSVFTIIARARTSGLFALTRARRITRNLSLAPVLTVA